MTILQLCKKFPFPVLDGETLAIQALSQSLARAGARISLMAMNTTRHPYRKEAGESWPDALCHYQEIRLADVDNRITPAGAFLNLFSKDSYHISRFRSEAYAQALATWLQEQAFDAVILETPYLAPYIPVLRRYSKARIVMRAHNVESEIWDRIALNLPPGPKRLYLRYLTRKLRRFEQRMLQHYDLLAAITERDLDQFRAMGFHGRGIVLPVGLDLEQYPQDLRSFDRPLSLGFIGSLDWAPNIEGLQWFLKEIWPHLHREFPGLTLHIAGRSAPDWLLRLQAPNVTMHGEVPDARAFLLKHSILLAPLRSGGGIRVKILEGMALGRVVLSTAVGLEGIPAVDRRHALIADHPEAFVQQLRFAEQSQVELREIAVQARLLMATQFDQEELASRLLRELFPGVSAASGGV